MIRRTVAGTELVELLCACHLHHLPGFHGKRYCGLGHAKALNDKGQPDTGGDYDDPSDNKSYWNDCLYTAQVMDRAIDSNRKFFMAG